MSHNQYAYGGQPGPYAVPPTPPPAPRRPRWWKVLLSIGAGTLGLIVLIGVIATATAPGETAKVPAEVTTSAAKPKAAKPTAAPSTPPLPPATSSALSDGMWIVGTDVKPGRYYATVPADVVACYWARLKDTDGSLESIIANNVVQNGRAVITIKRSDFAVEIRCGDAQWKLSGR